MIWFHCYPVILGKCLECMERKDFEVNTRNFKFLLILEILLKFTLGLDPNIVEVINSVVNTLLFKETTLD